MSGPCRSIAASAESWLGVSSVVGLLAELAGQRVALSRSRSAIASVSGSSALRRSGYGGRTLLVTADSLPD